MKNVLFLALLCQFSAFAQLNVRDSSINQFFMGANYKFNMTGGDLAKRWGFNNAIGMDIQYKFKNNLTVGIDGSFIFGNQLKDTTIFDGVYNSYGTITSMEGSPAAVLFLMRGTHVNAGVGYVFNKLGNNPTILIPGCGSMPV